MKLLGKQQQDYLYPEKNYCLITERSKSSPDEQAEGNSIWSSHHRGQLSQGLLAQKQRNVSLWQCLSSINEYTETEAAWVGKVPVQYETIHSSLQLVPFFCCCLSFCIISAREWVWVRRKESPMAAPLSEGEEERKEKGKQLSLLGPLHHCYLLTQRSSTQMNKACCRGLFLQLQIPSMNLCNLLKSSVSNILCLLNEARRGCPLERISKTSYEKYLAVCLIFSLAAVLPNLFLPGESGFNKIR